MTWTLVISRDGQLHLAMRILASFLVLLALVSLGGCGQDPPGLDKLPEALPYRFVDYCPYSGNVFNICLDSSCTPAIYEIQNGEEGASHSSIIIGYLPANTENRLTQINSATDFYNSHWAGDLDNDGVQELLYTFYHNDTAHLQMWNHNLRRDKSLAIATGKDLDGDGHWSGKMVIGACGDLNCDDTSEILVIVETGFDRFPREVRCLDWAHDSVLWTFPLAGHGCSAGMTVVRGAREQMLVVFGAAAPANGVALDKQADSLSYLFCMNQAGEQTWSRVCGGSFSSVHPQLVRTRDGMASHIICERSQRDPGNVVKCGLLLMDLQGQVQDSVDLPGTIRTMYTNYSGEDGQTVTIVVLENNQLLVFDGHLNRLNSYANVPVETIFAYDDFIGDGNKQYLVRLINGHGALLSRSFDLIALTSQRERLGPITTESGELSVARYQGRRGSMIMTLERTLWTLVFSRYPILAFLAALLPLGILVLIVWYILAIRQKNRFIERQQIAIDRTTADLQAAQVKLVEAEKYKQAQSIAGGVAHEIHNALFPALASLEKLSQRIRDDVPPEERDREMLDISREAVTRGLKMTDLVKLYSRLESEAGDETVDLLVAAHNALARLDSRISQSDIHVDLDIPKGCAVRCKQIHLDSILGNLLGNALDAMEHSPERHLQISAAPVDDIIQIVTADSGCGMTEDESLHAFDVFFTSKPDTGTGLGLSIVKKIVELYGGSISADSVLDKGTKMTILLPKGR